MYVILGLICIGLLGASLFGSGMISNMSSLTIAGICLTVLNIIGTLIVYACNKKPPTQFQTQSSNPSQPSVVYSSNNMSTMKRNKSDTDLELINRNNEEV